MSTLFELKDEILKGRRARLSIMDDSKYITCLSQIHFDDAVRDDWELMPLPKVKKKVKLYAYALGFNNAETGQQLHMLGQYQHDRANPKWKRIPNLDQEIEVEE